MARTYMARLGEFEFSLDTAPFQNMERSSSFKWATVERVGTKPALQFTGADAESVTLSGVIYPHFRGGLGQIEYLRSMASDGAPYDLYVTNERVGDHLGLFVIESIRETRTVFFEDGAPKKIEFTITLKEYGE